jgi:hypothetical protein
MTTFDAIVIGGGIAGLYAAFKLCVRKKQRVLVLEKQDTLGGRARMADFEGTRVVTGAGIGRYCKDSRLQTLLRDMHVVAHGFQVTHTTLFPCAYTSAMFQAVKHAFESDLPQPCTTFRKFGQQVLGTQGYKDLVRCSGYTDFERADVADVLYNYGFEDNVGEWRGLSVPWDALILSLHQALVGSRRCVVRTGCAVTALAPQRDGRIAVHTTQGRMLGQTVVLATEIDTLRALLAGQAPMYNHVHGQPFVRMYAKFGGSSARLLRTKVSGVTIVGAPLQKVIAVSDSVYMVAYCDNKSALYMRDLANNPKRVARLLEGALGLGRHSLRIRALQTFFFTCGTHYNDPELFAACKGSLRKLQRPLPNVLVVGEAVSRHQGWVEGALESVDAVIR